ncbi:MAG: serine/threonine protein kinase, partial [Deltaproteobacteria bacterium]|nr:serine/threonine protein kinase [Deltaproteobacteria bacterium]
EILDTIAKTLQAAHDAGVIHRDLKPDNVFLVDVPGERSRAKLLDFGLAKLTGEMRPDRTRAGSMLGTPQYLAPEQARGEADYRADLYGLGVMLFELVSGRLPFEGKNTVDVVSMHLLEAPPRLSTCAQGVTQELDDLVDAMLAKEPADRPSLLRVRATVDKLATPASSKVLATGIRTERARGSNLGIKLAIAGLLGALAMVITFLVVRGGSDESPKHDRRVESPPASREAKRDARREAKRDEVEVLPVAPVAPLEAKGTLVIEWKGSKAARFSIDGHAVSANEPLAMAPGTHKVAVFLNGATSTQKVQIHAGDTTRVPIKPPTRAPSRDDSLNPLNNAPR